MTYLSFDSYIRQARESEGTIRVAKGTQTELVNKGTLGNSLATFFTNIGRAIGLGVRPPARSDEGATQRAGACGLSAKWRWSSNSGRTSP